MSVPKVVFQNERGFITDFEAPQFAMDESGKVVMEIPRFGVWQMSSRGKNEVTLSTNNYTEALRKLGLPGLSPLQNKILNFLHEYGDSTAKQIARGLRVELTAVESDLGCLFNVDKVRRFGMHYRVGGVRYPSAPDPERQEA